MAADAVDILKHFNYLYDGDASFRTLWQELADFNIPRKSRIITKRTPGAKLTSPLMYDSTAPSAVTDLAAAIHGSLTDPKFQWFGLEFEQDELNEDGDAKIWLENAARKIVRRQQRSNFDAEIQEVYSEVVSMATGAIFTDALTVPKTKWNLTGFGGFRHKALAIGSYVIAEDEHGRVDTLMNKFGMTLRSAAAKFGKDALPERWRKKLETHPFELVDVLHAVYPRLGGQKGDGVIAKKQPYASCWVAFEEKHLLHESGFHEFPYAVVRWTKQADEVWGRGPSEVALPDIRTLNEAVKLRLQAWALAVKPPMEAKDRGVLGKPDTRPSAINYVREMGNLKAIDFGAKFDVANFNEKELREAIKTIYFIDKLQLPMKSIITATESNQRVKAMHRILGPTLGRLDDELLRRMITRQFALMFRAGEFGDPPPSVLEYSGGDAGSIDLRFEGPLARAQREQELEAMSSFINSVAPLVQIEPSVADNVDFDKYVIEAAKATSLTRLIRPAKEREKRRAERAQAQAEAQQFQRQIDMAKAAGQASGAIREVAAAQQPPVESRL